jgi:hypothetical protein
MASIYSEPGGRRGIRFADSEGARKNLRLGKCSQRQAESVAIHLERLVAAKLTGHAPPDETSVWVANLNDVLAKRLAAVGLIPKPEAKTVAKLAVFLDGYVSERQDAKPATKLVWGTWFATSRITSARSGTWRRSTKGTPMDSSSTWSG